MLKRVLNKITGGDALAKKLGLISEPPAEPKQPDARKFLLKMLPVGGVGAEIGVHVGNFSQLILKTTKPRELHLIDPWEHQSAELYKTAWYGGRVKGGQKEMDVRFREVKKRFRREIKSGVVRLHRGYSAPMLEKFPSGYFDWIYIDGNHLYEYVKKDLELSLEKVKSGGFITGDDYGEGGWWEGGVKKAVDEFAASQPVEMLKLYRGQFIFRKK